MIYEYWSSVGTLEDYMGIFVIDSIARTITSVLRHALH